MNNKPTILLVDDEQKVLNLMKFRLQFLGYRVLTTTHGEEALSLAREHHPDLVILDVMMPGLDGLIVCSRMKKAEDLHGIPVLVLTARSDMEDVNKAMSAGADDYIVKPYDPSVLQMKIHQHLGTGAVSSAQEEGRT